MDINDHSEKFPMLYRRYGYSLMRYYMHPGEEEDTEEVLASKLYTRANELRDNLRMDAIKRGYGEHCKPHGALMPKELQERFPTLYEVCGEDELYYHMCPGDEVRPESNLALQFKNRPYSRSLYTKYRVHCGTIHTPLKRVPPKRLLPKRLPSDSELSDY